MTNNMLTSNIFLQHHHLIVYKFANHLLSHATLLLLNCSCCSNSVAEINTKRKQKELEESVAQSGQTYPSHSLHVDSLYDEISANNKQMFATQPCPAYAPLPPPPRV